MERCRGSVGKCKGVIPAILCACLLALAPVACGKNERSASHAPGGTSEESTGATSSAGSGEMSAAGPVAETASPEKRYIATVVPSTPSRLIPPRIAVREQGGGTFEILSVRWRVNGSVVVSHGERLPPDRFSEGDRIGATVMLMTAEGEREMVAPEVVAGRSLPSVTNVRLEPEAMRVGDTVKAVVTADNPDGERLAFQYTWFVDDTKVPGETAELSLKNVKKGSWVHVRVTPHDGVSDGGWRYSPKYRVRNALPTVKAPSTQTLSADGVLTYGIAAEDPDGNPMPIELVTGPPGMTLSGSTFVWAVPDSAFGRAHEAVIRVSDGEGGSAIHTISIKPQKP